jgi:TRAP-type C4-dicarboxylate transport system permease small subunit
MGFQNRLVKVALGSEAELHTTSRVMVYVAALALFGMMMVTVGDIVGRYFFDKPIMGAYELVGFLMVFAGPWGMAYCQIRKGHIRVDFLFQRFPKIGQSILTILANLVGVFGFSLMCWRSALLTRYYLELTKGGDTDTLRIPIFPFALALTIGAGVLALVILGDLIHSFAEVKRN